MTDFFPNGITATPYDPDQWWGNYDNVVFLAYWMLERHEAASNIVHMVEKPWKWTDEYHQAREEEAEEEAQAAAEMAEFKRHRRLPGESYTAMVIRQSVTP